MSLREAAEEGQGTQGEDREVTNDSKIGGVIPPFSREVEEADVGAIEHPADFRMLTIYVSRVDTKDVRMDRTDFANWELPALMQYALEMEFGMRETEDEDES